MCYVVVQQGNIWKYLTWLNELQLTQRLDEFDPISFYTQVAEVRTLPKVRKNFTRFSQLKTTLASLFVHLREHNENIFHSKRGVKRSMLSFKPMIKC